MLMLASNRPHTRRSLNQLIRSFSSHSAKMGSIQPPPTTIPTSSIQRICIIGAGPSGLSFSKYLLAENTFSKIDIYESQAEVGGAWKYTPQTSKSSSAPQTNPHQPLESPLIAEDGEKLFPTPMYDTLRTNIPKMLMAYHDTPFEDDEPLFPSRQAVQEYLIRYSKEVRSLIKFQTQVRNVSVSKTDDGKDEWTICVRDLVTNHETTHIYDAVVVANGHYTVPYIPSIPGMAEFASQYPNTIIHSKYYRSPAIYANRKVVVIGNAASGSDIGSQIKKHCSQPLLWSIRTPTDAFGHDEREEVPEIIEYLPDTRGVKFSDGRIENDIDAVIYCTGYLYSFPFMSLPINEDALVTHGKRVCGLYKQLFHISHPTLAFPLLAQKVLPFPVSEFQAAAVARFWSGRISLPSKEDMWLELEKEVETKGDGIGYHVLMPRDADYARELIEMADKAETRIDQDGEEVGKAVKEWDEKFLWIRENFGKIRLAYANHVGVTTLEELGWDYEKHIKEKEDEIKDL